MLTTANCLTFELSNQTEDTAQTSANKNISELSKREVELNDLQTKTKNDSNGKDKGPQIVEKLEISADFLYESPAWKWFLNVNALLLIGITIFLYGFFH